MVIQREGFYGYPTGNKLKAEFTVGTSIFRGVNFYGLLNIF